MHTVFPDVPVDARDVQALMADDHDAWTLCQCTPGDLKAAYGIPMGTAVRLIHSIRARLEVVLEADEDKERANTRTVAFIVSSAVTTLLEVRIAPNLRTTGVSVGFVVGASSRRLTLLSQCLGAQSSSEASPYIWKRGSLLQFAFCKRLEREEMAKTTEEREEERKKRERFQAWAVRILLGGQTHRDRRSSMSMARPAKTTYRNVRASWRASTSKSRFQRDKSDQGDSGDGAVAPAEAVRVKKVQVAPLPRDQELAPMHMDVVRTGSAPASPAFRLPPVAPRQQHPWGDDMQSGGT